MENLHRQIVYGLLLVWNALFEKVHPVFQSQTEEKRAQEINLFVLWFVQ